MSQKDNNGALIITHFKIIGVSQGGQIALSFAHYLPIKWRAIKR
jgi:pimeloyl-ACP methyl ester carboxylesterase